jgi:exopolysaccharide biosynthesis polyprenyl glycosylphosphotransferase
MIRRHMAALRFILMIADGIAAALVLLLVSLVRFGDGEVTDVWRGYGIDIRVGAAVFGVVWVAALWYEGLYRPWARWNPWTEIRGLLKATLLVAVVTLAVLFLVKQEAISRLFLALLFVTQALVAMGVQTTVRGLFGAIRRRGRNTQYMLVVGTGSVAQLFADRIEGRRDLGIRVIGHVSASDEPDGAISRPVLGTVAEIGTVFHAHVVDEVAICLPDADAEWVEPVRRLAADEGKTVRIPLDPGDALLVRGREEEFEGFLVRSVVNDERRELALVTKRLVDIVGSVVGLVVLSPVLLVVALVIRWKEGAPILFRQTRVGLNGRPFTIYKFRTMVPGAEAHLDEVQHLNERSRIAFKATDDPRVTPLGRTLRARSIDELPQLWNVLRGDMSLVGPRPPIVSEVARYDIWHRRRLSMKPGITGLWQVEARREPEFDRWVERDLAYIDRWSLLLDLRILLKTVPAVLLRTGK